VKTVREAVAAVVAGAMLLGASRSFAQTPRSGREELLRSNQTRWDSLTVQGVRLYFSTASVPRHRERGLARLAARAVTDVSRRLKIANPPVITVMFVGSPDELPPHVGSRGRGWSSGRDTVAIVVTNDTLGPALTHELTHVLTYQAWGRPAEPSAWIMEGIATSTSRRCGAHDLRAIGKMLLQAHRLPSILRRTRDFRTLPQGETYASAGTFVEYLERRVGADTPKRIWSAGADSLAAIAGRDPHRLESEWHEYLEQFPETAPSSMIVTLAGRGCT
jgi:hypothetical protein